MIQMPQRPVTRFFIPLLDVLILLFCIFLLMDFNSKSKVSEQDVTVENQSEWIEALDTELRRTRDELEQFNEDRPKLVKLKELEDELKRLRDANRQTLQQRSFFKVIDIDRFTGKIAYYDEERKTDPLIPIDDERAAHALIERHLKEAKERSKTDVYYYFMRTRPTDEERKAGKAAGGFPIRSQILQYKTWFSKTANNLSEFL